MAKKKTTKKKSSAASRGKSNKPKTTKKPDKAAKSSKKTTAAKKKKAPAKKMPVKKPLAKKKTPKKKTTAKKSSATPKKKIASAKKAKTTSTKKTVTLKVTSEVSKKSEASKKSEVSKKVVKEATASSEKALTSKKKKAPVKKRSARLGSSSVAEAASAATPDAQGYVIINGRRVRTISTKGLNLGSKKKSTKAKKEVSTETLVEKAKVVKSKLVQKTLDEFRQILLAKRAELIGDLSTIEAGALGTDGSNTGIPIHMADLGSDAFDQDFALGMAESERMRLREIDEALQRIEDGTYGVCQMTGKAIPRARLLAKPWAKYTIESARQAEGGWSG